MKHPHLIPRKSGNKTNFHFRTKIPIDLIPTFSGRIKFQISLKNVTPEPVHTYMLNLHIYEFAGMHIC